jgi:hypothetical protein
MTEMSSKAKYRINITRKVTGRMGDGEMVLYYNKKPIGKIDLRNMGMEVVDGFEVEENSIYAVGNQFPDEHYTQSCDMGWC